MKLSFLAFLFATVLSITPSLHAEDPDKDTDDAINEAANAAKKMGVKMPDVKKELEQVDKEEAKEKPLCRNSSKRRDQ
jgi:hypothetical protein